MTEKLKHAGRGLFFISTLFIVNSFGITLYCQVKLSEQKWIIPTYKVNPPDKNPMFFKGEVYQGASKYIYPYKLIDNLSNERADSAWKTLILENEYIKLCITPDIGGKLYYGTDKTNGYNFLYKNNVVKPANIGMLGAWVSGGIEWCVIHHHRASTFLPVDYDMVENEDGSKTVWIGEIEPRHQMRWTIGITVFPGKSYYQTEVKIHNRTPLANSFLYWANVAVNVNDNYQVIFPPSVDNVTYHAKNSFSHWPVSHEIYNKRDYTQGVDISWWKNSPASVSFFANDLKEDFMGGYDHGKESGTVHIGDHNIVKGAKLWEWGSGSNGQATEAKLTETDGPYAEIMVGAFSDNQPDYSWIQPYEVKTFKQYWYPVKDIQGFKNANLNGAVNLEKREGNTVFLGYYSTCKIAKAKILLKNKGKVIFEKVVEISPEKTFTGTVKIGAPFEMTDLSTEMINSENNENLVSYQPVKNEYKDSLPETVKRPSSPEEIKTVEELFLTGQRIQQFYNPTLNAMSYYDEALKRDPSDIRTNIAVGKTALRNGDYVKARSYFSTAIKRITKDYTRPIDCEVLYLQGITLKAMDLYTDAVDTLYRATWDYAWHSAAYLELARISCEQGDFVKALGQVDESLSTNSKNNNAINLKASILRELGDFEGAKSTLAPLLKADPLDFRACNENYLIAKEQGDPVMAEKNLVSLTRKMRDFDQNYLEISTEYLNDGLLSESEDLLRRFKGSNQLIDYYLGYISDKKGNREQAALLFRAGSLQNVDYCFPYRLETIKIFNKALEYDPKDAKACYYLGNVLYDKQPGKAIECWEKAVKSDPALAIAYRNLGWGYFRNNKDIPKAISAYESAIAANNTDPVYYAELDPLYEIENSSIEKRLALFASSHEVVRKHDNASVREIKVLTLAGKADKAVEYLEAKYFSYREGSSIVRNITVDARLMLGMRFMADGKYDEALKQFLEANVLGEDSQDDSRTGDMRTPQVEYFIGLAFEALGEKEKAKSYFQGSADKKKQDASFISFYQGLSYLKLGNKEQAYKLFNRLIKNGEEEIKNGGEVNFFAKFGESESKSELMSQAHLLIGLGYKGLGKLKLAKENLDKAIGFSNSNLWARAEY
jgi:tetratricopeptide (TPR) repeat protein